ncbi:MAG TPA: M20/M25/M40 family metallo-hydrolase [Thermoanaerobaculia bacterium]|nr:M20/M25/M40 family metallo-hydrolase [Thermoanaerobaculia bacterium]
MGTRTWLERRFRLAARFALYGSLVVVAATAVGLASLLNRPPPPQATERWIEVDYRNLPAVQLLQRYVQIDTSRSTGDEVAGARFLAAQLEAAGIPARIEQLDGRHANLYASLAGRDPRPLVLHNHIDVTDVDLGQWFYPPFAARIELPWIYGRGVFDMKSVAIAQLLAVIDLKRSGKPLRRSVLFLATGDEEEGDSWLGARWVIAQHPALVKTFWALLTEGGTVEARTRSNIKYWGTEVAQRHYADLRVCGGSKEELEALRQELIDAGHQDTDLRMTPEVREVLSRYVTTRDSALLRAALARTEDMVGDVAAFRELPGYLRSMLHNEAVPYDVEEAPGGGYELLVKLQILPGLRAADVRDRLVPPWMLHGLHTTLEEPPGSPGASPINHPVLEEIIAGIHADFPGAPAGPFFLPFTATDARFFRAAGVPSYGFSPFLIMSTDTLQADRSNERMALPGYVQGIELYRKIVRQLVM